MKTYKGYDYIAAEWKRELMHMRNGYVRLPKEHPLYREVNKTKRWDFSKHVHEHKNYDAANDVIDVHGGFTFAEDVTKKDILRGRWMQKFIPGLWIGWDYAHLGDCFWDHKQDEKMTKMGLTTHLHKHDIGFNDKHWTLREIEQDCKSVIDQLIKLTL